MPKAQNKQVLRRKQINGQTLVIGADVSKEFNSLVLMEHQGQILKMLSKVYNDYTSYRSMIEHVRAAQKSKGSKKVIMGLEPTGHYWRKLAHKAHSEGIKVVFVKTTAVKITESFAEIDPADPVKYDFALTRIGILENCTGHHRSGCQFCELFAICFHG